MGTSITRGSRCLACDSQSSVFTTLPTTMVTVVSSSAVAAFSTARKPSAMELDDHDRFAIFWVMIAIAVIGAAGNLAVALLVKSGELLKCSFGTLSVNRCIANFTGILFYAPFMACALFRKPTVPQELRFLGGTVIYFSYNVTTICNLLLAVNRISVFFHFKSTASLFSRKWIVSLLLFIWFISFVLCSPTIFTPCNFILDADSLSWNFQQRTTCGKFFSTLTTCIDYFLAVFLLLMSAFIIGRIVEQLCRFPYPTFDISEKDRQFVVQEFLITIVFVLSLVSLNFRKEVDTSQWGFFVFFKLNWLLVICIDPWITITVNRLMMLRILAIFGFKSNRVSVSVVNLNPQPKHNVLVNDESFLNRAFLFTRSH